jgi:hypothetical protein
VQFQVHTVMISSIATIFTNNRCVYNKPRCKNIREIPILEVQKIFFVVVKEHSFPLIRSIPMYDKVYCSDQTPHNQSYTYLLL